MEVIRDLTACPRPAEGSVVSVGVYDGVHLGHRYLMGELRRLAAERGALAAVVTFDRHPAEVIRPTRAPRLLTSLEQRLELLAATGVDVAVVLRFDAERAAEPAEEFVHEVLVGCLAARAVVVGENFTFGRGARGDVELLRRMGADLGFEVDGLRLAASGAEGARPVSSTAIRQALREGDLAAANRMLGRPHEVRGTVAPGDERGRDLGFPTANLAVDPRMQLPADGIYAGWFVRASGEVLPAAINVGRRPTFHADAEVSLVEAHVLDFEGDLYGEAAAVRFAHRLRDEVRFDSVDALVDQMRADVARTREVLAS